MTVFPITSLPLTIPGCKLWLDGSVTTAGSVSSWTDLSGFGNHAIQATGSAQPTCTANTLAGKNALVFDGGDSLTASLTALVSRLLPFTVFIVFKANVITANDTILSSNISASNRFTCAWEGTAASLISATYNGSAYTIKSASFNNTTLPHILTVTNSSSNVIAQYIDTVTSSGGATPSTSAASSEFRIGGSLSGARFNGVIGEIIIYNSELSASNLTLISKYLSNKWSVSI